MQKLLLPLSLIVIGALALFGNFLPDWDDIEALWPAIPMVAAVMWVLNEKLNRSNLVPAGGVFFFFGCWLLTNIGWLNKMPSWPVWLIVLGVLLLLKQLPFIPEANQSADLPKE